MHPRGTFSPASGERMPGKGHQTYITGAVCRAEEAQVGLFRCYLSLVAFLRHTGGYARGIRVRGLLLVFSFEGVH